MGLVGRCGPTAPGRGAGTVADMHSDDVCRVWILWDCGELLSVHATEAGAEFASADHTAKVRADLGVEWAAGRPLHISVSWYTVQN